MAYDANTVLDQRGARLHSHSPAKLNDFQSQPRGSLNPATAIGPLEPGKGGAFSVRRVVGTDQIGNCLHSYALSN